jgi:TPR repeat protein
MSSTVRCRRTRWSRSFYDGPSRASISLSLLGAAKDTALAAHWYRIAAQGGDVGAMYIYASMAEAGDGVAQDLHESRYWYAAAARNGDEAAPSKLKEIDARLGPS